MYQKITFYDDQINIYKIDEEINIPVDKENRHYQQYLQWLAEGNEPEVIEIN